MASDFCRLMILSEKRLRNRINLTDRTLNQELGGLMVIV